MKFLYRILFFLILSASGYTQAGHIIGGEVSYECLGGSGNTYTYAVTLTLFRDALNSGTDFDGFPLFGLIEEQTGLLYDLNGDGNINIPQNSDYLQFSRPPELGDIDLTYIEENPCLTAQVANITKYIKYFYEITITFPDDGESGFYLSYARCCRNNIITNLQNAGEQGGTFASYIPHPDIAGCNSSPEYNEFPRPVLCLNEPFDLDYSVTDIDGDSIAYRLCSPFKGGSRPTPQPEPVGPPFEPLDYRAPYDFANPMDANPALAINPETGFITGTPNTTGRIYVVGVCAEEYKDGKFIQDHRREYQFQVVDCSKEVIADIGTISTNGNTNRICLNEDFEFTNNGDPSNEFVWDFGDGASSTQFEPSHIYTAPGTYTIQLTVNPGFPCEDIEIIEVQVLPRAEFSMSADTVKFSCEELSIRYTPQSTISPFFGEYIYKGVVSSQPGSTNFSVNAGENEILRTTVIAEGSCNRTFKRNYNLFIDQTRIESEFNFDRNFSCDSLFISTNNLSTEGKEFEWRINGNLASRDKDPDFNFKIVGDYDISLIAKNTSRCNQADTFGPLSIVFTKERVSFNEVLKEFNSCEDTSFLDYTGTTASNATRFEWDFGDGRTSTEVDPYIPFAPDNNGIFTVVGKAINENTCNQIDSIVNVVFKDQEVLVADFKYSFIKDCNTPRIQFINTSNGNDLVAWDFNDGLGTGAGDTIVYEYNNFGTYEVKQYVYDDRFCNLSDTIVKDVFVSRELVNAQLRIDSTINCTTGTYTVYADHNNATAFSFRLPDGSLVSEDSITFTLFSGESYHLTAYATNPNTCNRLDSTKLNITFTPVNGIVDPTYEILANDCQKMTVSFNANNSSPNAQYTWFFGDNSSSTGQNPLHTYSRPGIYNVQLIARNTGTCAGNQVYNLVVPFLGAEDPFDLDINVNNIGDCENPIYQLVAVSNLSPESISWKLDGDFLSNEISPITELNNEGVNDIELTFNTSEHCIGTKTFAKLISPNPDPITADFELIREPNCSLYIASVAATEQEAQSYEWKISGLGRKTSSIVDFTLPNTSGSSSNPSWDFSVNLIISDSSRCNIGDTVTKHFFSNTDSLVTNITQNRITDCNNPSIDFFANTNGENGSSNWMVNGQLFKVDTLNYILSEVGEYEVILEYTDNDFCNVTSQDTIQFQYSEEPIVAEYNGQETITCQEINIPLTFPSTYSNVIWLQDGIEIARNEATNLITSPPFNALLQMVVVDSFNCNFSDTVDLSYAVQNIPIIAELDADSVFTCDQLSINLSADDSEGRIFQWNRNIQDSDTSFTLTDPGTAVLEFIVTDSTFCNLSDTLIRRVEFDDTRLVAAYDTTEIRNCNKLEVSFQNSSNGGKQLRWQTSVNTITQNFNFIKFNNYGVFPLEFTVTDSSFCNKTDRILDTIYYLGPIEFQANYPSTNCSDEEFLVELIADSDASIEVNWGDGTIESDLMNYTHDYSPGNYTISYTLINPKSCERSKVITKSIQILENPQADFRIEASDGSTDLYACDQIQFINQTPSGFTASEWEFGDTLGVSNNNNSFFAFPKSNTPYNICLTSSGQGTCKSVICKTINLDNCIIDVASAFNPNSVVGNNEVKVFGTGFKEFSLQIYNRYGQLVFQTTDPTEGWNGTLNGELQDVGVYVYVLNAVLKNDELVNKSGDITLIK